MENLPTEALRHEFYLLNRDRCQALARRAEVLRATGQPAMMVVCIHVDDPAWTELANELMPDQDWAPIRARGDAPVARGLVLREGVQAMLSETCPDVAPAFSDPEAIYIAVMAAGGVSIYPTEPSDSNS